MGFFSYLSKTSHILGKGLMAGIFGTAAITISQIIEMKITKREESKATVKVGGEVLGVEPKGLAEQEKAKAEKNGETSRGTKEEVEKNEQKFGQIMHFGYGTAWGVARGILDLGGIHGLKATGIHFGAVWGTALVMLPSAGASEPVTKWTPREIAIDILHHAVYALAAGFIYDGLKGTRPDNVRRIGNKCFKRIRRK